MCNKKQQRRQAYEARQAQPDKDAVSRLICAEFIAQPEYQQAKTVMWYVHCRSEVITLPALASELKRSKRRVIPYCTHDEQGQKKLGLWLLEDINELVPGTWGILEPPQARWTEVEKQVDVRELDLIMVPGVAFDRNGGRLGNGAGYYDRLLEKVRKDAVLTAVCFESQLFERIEMEQHDIYMDKVITEQAIYSKLGTSIPTPAVEGQGAELLNPVVDAQTHYFGKGH